MKPEWLEFLINAGAEIENNKVTSFGNLQREQRMLQTGLVICDLSHHRLISVDGDDASDFLQGQLTNDVRDVSEKHSQLSAYCTHKGRMLANFRLFKRASTFYICLPQPLLESILKRISMFVLMSKVSMKDASTSLVKIGLSGPTAEQQLADIVSDVPTEVDDVSTPNGYSIIKCAGEIPRYEIYGELDEIKKLWGQLDVNAAPAGSHAWEMLDILAGIPTITLETSEAFVPHMTNMHVINGVNFQKGCYTGQEVVARMQYLGKLKRRMYRVHIDSDEPVLEGEKLFSQGSNSGQGPGNIVNSQPNVEGGYNALAVINLADVQTNTLQLRDENGPTITIDSLPYNIEE